MKVVINECFGGFGLSVAAYEKLIEYGVPVQPYVEQTRDPLTHRFNATSNNEGEVIFDRTLTPRDSFCDKTHIRVMGRYWDCWTRGSRTHPLIIKVVEELGAEANGDFAKLKVVTIPDDVEYTIEDYDGNEHIAEVYQTWS